MNGKTGEVRWVPPENVHLTLQFLGAVPEERFAAVEAALRDAAATAGRPLSPWAAAVVGSRATRAVLAGLGLLVTAWTLLALVLGADTANNPVPWVVFVLLWVGIVPLSVVLGPVWRRLNPLRTVHALVNRAAGLDPADGVRPLPEGLGWWPAALGLGAFLAASPPAPFSP